MSSERGRTRDLNKLSAYLDGTLKENQREKLRFRLEREPELRQWFENLQQTKDLLGKLPRIRAPHNFTLTPNMVTVRSPKKQPIFNSLRLASSLAAALLVVLLGVEYLIVGGRLPTRSFLEAPLMDSVSEVSEAHPEPLIQWGAPNGEGGGADMGIGGMGAGSPVIESPLEESPYPPPEAEMEEVEEEMPLAEVQDSETDEKRIPETINEAESSESGSDTEDDLILGINPEQAGDIIDRSESAKDVKGVPFNWQKVLRWVQIGLAIIVLGGGLAIWILRRKRFS